MSPRWSCAAALLISSLPLGPCAHAGVPDFSMELGVRDDRGEVFGVPPNRGTRHRRLYPGETASGVVTGVLENADATGLTNEALVAGLQVCALPGDQTSVLGTNVAMPCQSLPGVTWSIVPIVTGHHLSAELASANLNGLTGQYTVFVVLESAEILARLGEYAPAQLRSTPVTIKCGPPANADEELSMLLNAGYRAQAAENWAAEKAAAEAIIAIYPNSVLALCLLGDARAELGDTPGAIAAYESALEKLDAGQDTRTPAMSDLTLREGQRRGILYALEELTVGVTP